MFLYFSTLTAVQRYRKRTPCPGVVEVGMGMTPEERRFFLCVWNGTVVFGSVYYLTGQFWKTTIIAVFVFVSCLLNFGARWLVRAGFALALFTILIAVGLVPQPTQWPDHIKDAYVFVRNWKANGPADTELGKEALPALSR